MEIETCGKKNPFVKKTQKVKSKTEQGQRCFYKIWSESEISEFQLNENDFIGLSVRKDFLEMQFQYVI